MSRPQARKGDTETCPKCPMPPYCPTGPLAIMNCTHTYVNNRIPAVVGDGIVCCAIATAIEGSSSVYIENRQAHRLGDANSCGVCIEGSPDVYVGD